MLLLFYVLQHSLQHQCASEFGAYSQHSNLHPKKYFLPLKYLLPLWHGQVRYFQIWMRWNDRKVKWWARLQTQFCVWFWLLLPCMPHALNISVFLIKINVNPPPLVLSDLVLPLMLQLRCSWHVVLFDVLRCQMKVKVKIQILDFLKVLLSYFFILDRWNSSYSKSTHAVKCTVHLVELHPTVSFTVYNELGLVQNKSSKQSENWTCIHCAARKTNSNSMSWQFYEKKIFQCSIWIKKTALCSNVTFNCIAF